MTLNGVVAAKGLTTEQIGQIRKLAELCDKTDNIRLKLNWNFLETRPVTETNDWLFYENGELAGFLAMYAFSLGEAEFSGMVHPDFRRGGIFSRLVEEAKSECTRRGIPKLLFMNQKGSASGKIFLEQLGATYVISEYWMDYDRLKTRDMERGKELTGSLHLRKAVRYQDDEMLIRLDVLGFGDTEEAARAYVINTWDSMEKTTLIAEIDGAPSGKINFQMHDGNAHIYGFCMVPGVRGQGYGRKVLEETIRQIESEAPGISMSLEVATENDRALSLYESCGFRSDNANDYYELKLG